MMKNIITFFLFTLLIAKASGQTLKTYSGSYSGGQAKYQYYENAEYERVFEGSFFYTTSKDNLTLYRVHIPSTLEISGTFKNNLKNGTWDSREIITTTIPQYGDAKITLSYNGRFNNGKKGGLWVFKQSAVTAKKTESKIFTLNFNNNVLIDSVSLSNIQGNLDSKGNFIGTWNLKNDGIEFIAEFNRNVFTKLIKRKISTGEILYKYINPDIVNLYFESLQSNKKVSLVNEKYYGAINCVKLNNEGSSQIEYNENNKFFVEFYDFVFTHVKAFDENLLKIQLGSSESTILIPLVISEFKGRTPEEYEDEVIKLNEDEESKAKREIEETNEEELKEQKRLEEQKLNNAKLAKSRQLERTDLGQLQRRIKSQLTTTWLAKTDYETQINFEARVKNKTNEQIKIITTEVVQKEKQKLLQTNSLDYENYNSETQSFALFFREDTFNVFVPNSIAEKFENAFAVNRLSENKWMGRLVPLEIDMINNKWTVTHAAIFFNNNYSFGHYLADFKRFYKQGDEFFFDFEYRPDINELKTTVESVRVDNIETIFKSEEIPKKVFYYEWKSEPKSIQQLDFTTEDLNITLPN